MHESLKYGLALAGLGVLGGAAALGWGGVERRFPVLREVEVLVTDRGWEGECVVLHFSDLHMYPGQEFIRDFLARVLDEHHVDLVVSTGDNLGAASGLTLAVETHDLFSRAGVPGVFVCGSNDYYSPRRKSWTRYLRRDPRVADKERRVVPDLPWYDLVSHLTTTGWIDLSNRADSLEVTTGSGTLRIAFVGVDDPHIDRDRFPEPDPGWADADLRLGVMHAPYRRVLDACVRVGADLALAGHTHGGQFGIPGCDPLVTNCDLPRSHGKGLHTWATADGGTVVNVSAGLGTSPFVPFRIATRAEATLIRVRSI